jgi:methionyl-tRNA formyltransferase
MKIVFMGTDDFSVVILRGLINRGFKPVLVITETDKPVGRKKIITPPPVKILAQEYKIPVEQPKKIEECKLKIRNLRPDLIVVAAYGQIIPKSILDIPRHGCLNVHPSLLPRWRGPSPIQYAILNNDRKTGVTIILIDEKIDHGPILGQREIIIDKDETGKTLYEKLADLGTRLLLETIFRLEKGLVKPRSQDEEKATYSKILSRQDGKINWKKTAEEIERQIRAFELWPKSFTLWQSTRELLKIKILKTRILKSRGGITYPIGKTLIVPQNQICVQCGKGLLPGKGDFLVIERLQLEGKKEMTSEEFLRGHPSFTGTILK